MRWHRRSLGTAVNSHDAVWLMLMYFGGFVLDIWRGLLRFPSHYYYYYRYLYHCRPESDSKMGSERTECCAGNGPYVKRLPCRLGHCQHPPFSLHSFPAARTHLIVCRKRTLSLISSGILLRMCFRALAFSFRSWNSCSGRSIMNSAGEKNKKQNSSCLAHFHRFEMHRWRNRSQLWCVLKTGDRVGNRGAAICQRS